jgi:phospholipid/cholesterol/gamma-HCH transport system permease protein
MYIKFLLIIQALQDFAFFTLEVVKGFFSVLRYRKETLNEMYWVGASAFSLIFVAGLFEGIILAVETGHQLAEFGAETLVGRSVSLGMVRELGPVITGLLLAARTGSKNASELGGMQLSEQIDALRAFGTSPILKLIVPKTVAAVVMFLPLTLMADFIGIVGGMFVTSLSLHVDISFFWHSALGALQARDIITGYMKPIFFGFFVATISCFYGYTTKGGTVGLGRNTIKAVVFSSLAVIILDFVFTQIIWMST